MTAFGKLVRTTAFRLTLVYLLLFAMFAASLLAYFAWNTRRLITEEITQTVNAETSEISEIYGRRGLRALVLAIEYRALRPGAKAWSTDACVPISRLADCIVASKKDLDESPLTGTLKRLLGDITSTDDR